MKKLSDSRVLIVDDAKSNLDLLVEGLKTDYKLSLAINGENIQQEDVGAVMDVEGLSRRRGGESR